jgi:hypothetical protein
MNEYPDLWNILESILLGGASPSFEIENEAIQLGASFGILAERNGFAHVSNMIFEKKLYSYFSSKAETGRWVNHGRLDPPGAFVREGRLNMQLVLERFAAVMKSERRKSESRFVETNARLLFLVFLKPIINGSGFYEVEANTRDNTRMDIVVSYGKDEFILELKIGHGKKLEKEAYDQLAGYLDARSQKRGYLVSFCSNITTPERGTWLTHKGFEIYEEVIPFLEGPSGYCGMPSPLG